MTNHDCNDFIYNVVIMICHPTEAVDRITSELGIEPNSSHQAGEMRMARNGAPLNRINRDSRWWLSIGYRADHQFFGALQEVLDRLEAAQEYLYGLTATGGTVALTVYLAGQTTISDVLPASELSRMARVGVGLGIEVFPNMHD